MRGEDTAQCDGRAEQMKRLEVKKSKKRRKPASTNLRTAAEIVLRDEVPSVVEELAERCLAGDVQTVKLLYDLARGAEDDGRSFGSLTHRLDMD